MFLCTFSIVWTRENATAGVARRSQPLVATFFGVFQAETVEIDRESQQRISLKKVTVSGYLHSKFWLRRTTPRFFRNFRNFYFVLHGILNLNPLQNYYVTFQIRADLSDLGAFRP